MKPESMNQNGYLFADRSSNPMTLMRKIVVIVCIVLPVLIITLFSYSRLEENFREKIYEERSFEAALSARALYERLARLEDLGISIATRVAFAEAIEKQQWDVARTLIAKVSGDFPVVDGIVVTDTLGATKIKVNNPYDFSANKLIHQDLLDGVQENWTPYFSHVYLTDDKPHTIATSLAVPIKSTTAQTIGILILQVNVPKLLQWNEQPTHDDASQVTFVVDRKGTLIIDPDNPEPDSLVSYASVPAFKLALQGKKGVDVFFNPIENKNYLTAYEQVPHYNWVILLQQESQNAFAVKDNLQSVILLYTGILFCAFIVAAVVVREMSLRKRAEVNLQQSNKLFSDSFEHNPAALAISRIRDGSMIHVNRSFLQLFGFSRKDEVIGKKVTDLHIWNDLEKRQSMIKELLEKETPVNLEMQTREIHGTKRYVSGSIHLIEVDHEPCILAVALDSTERKNAEIQVREMNALLEQKVRQRTEEILNAEANHRAVIDQASDGMFISDERGNFIDANLTACTMLGYSKEELLNMNVSDILSKEEQTKNPPRFDQLQAGNVILTTRNLVRKNGSTVPAEISSKMLSNGRMLGIVRDVTERKRTEEKLRASEVRFRSIIEEFPRPVTTYAPDGKVTGANKAWETMWQDKRENSINQYNILKDQQLVSSGLMKYIHRAFAGEVVVSEQFEYDPALIGQAGRKRWMQMVLFPIHDDEGDLAEVIMIMEDLTSNKQAEMNYKEIFEKANDAIYIHEIESGRVIAVNQRATELTGFSKDELTSASPAELVSGHPDFTVEHAMHYMQKAAQGESQLFEWLGKRKDGSTSWYEVNLRKATIGGVDRILAFFHEINDRKKAQQDLEEFNKTLEIKVEERTQELAELNRELESFTYSVSHDLRAPLRSINGYSQMLFEDYKNQLDDEGQRIIQTIGNNSKRMGNLIDELLEFSRLGRKEIQKSSVDIKQLIERAIGEVCRMTECRAKIHVGKMYNVQADHNLLYQVIFNLISNAVKYSSKKEDPEVEIFCEKNENGDVVLHVKDNGVGFDMQYAHKLFGVFQRLHARHEFEGTGVGLAIVQRIIARHKGKVWAEAKKDEGAIFSFSLPRA